MYRIIIIIFAINFLSSCGKTDENSNNVNQSTLANINSLTDYDATIKTGVSLMFFHATWCTICAAQRPDVEGLTSESTIKGAKLGQVDTDKSKDITTKYSVSGQPVIVIYKDNVEKHRLFGKGHSKTKLADLIKALM